jgi:hypothetical protein
MQAVNFIFFFININYSVVLLGFSFEHQVSYSQKCRSQAKLNNVDKQTKGLMGFEPPYPFHHKAAPIRS